MATQIVGVKNCKQAWKVSKHARWTMHQVNTRQRWNSFYRILPSKHFSSFSALRSGSRRYNVRSVLEAIDNSSSDYDKVTRLVLRHNAAQVITLDRRQIIHHISCSLNKEVVIRTCDDLISTTEMIMDIWRRYGDDDYILLMWKRQREELPRELKCATINILYNFVPSHHPTWYLNVVTSRIVCHNRTFASHIASRSPKLWNLIASQKKQFILCYTRPAVKYAFFDEKWIDSPS